MSSSNPSPLVIPPLKNDHHTHTIILLHGRGSNGDKFGSVFLESTELARRLPTVKFIFPTARKRRSTVLKRIPIHQWFDNYSLEDPNTRTELQVDGLEDTSRLLRKLIDDEARLLRERNVVSLDHERDPPNIGGDEYDYGRVVIGGLSQGCAASVFCLLGGLSGHHHGPDTNRRLGGFVGMSGWLPLEGEITDLLKLGGEGEGEDDEDDLDDPFSHDDVDILSPSTQALNHVREVLELEPLQRDEECGYLQVPVFLGHGAADPKVSVSLGERMASVLSSGFGIDVTWKAYEDFGHWYKVPDEIDDVVTFLREKVGVPSVN